MKVLHMITFLLLVIGGLNWGIFGIFGVDLGSLLGGMDSMLARAIYVLVGLAAIVEILTHKKTCMMCKKKAGAEPMAGM